MSDVGGTIDVWTRFNSLSKWRWLFTLGGSILAVVGFGIRLYVLKGERERRRRDEEDQIVDPIAESHLRSIQRRMETYF